MRCFTNSPLKVSHDAHMIVRGIEWFMTVNWLGFGLIISAPGDSFSGHPFWRWFAQHGGEGFWGSAFMAGGLLGLLSLYTRNQKQRIAAALVSAILNGFLAIGGFVSDPTTVGGFTYITHTLLSYWLFRLVAYERES